MPSRNRRRIARLSPPSRRRRARARRSRAPGRCPSGRCRRAEVGRRMVGRLRHVDQRRVQVEHDRGFHQAGMFERPSGETIGPGSLHRLLADIFPVRNLGDPHVVDAIPPQPPQREVDSFDQKHVVLVVAVDHRHAAHAVASELANDVARHADQGFAVEAGGAGEVVTAARLGLRLVAVTEGGRDQIARACRDPLGERGGDHRIAVHGQMRPVLLQRADREDDDGLFLPHSPVILGPVDLRDAHGAGHGGLLFPLDRQL